MSELSKRLKYAREHVAGFKSARQFAIKNGYPPSTYGGYENGSRFVTVELAHTLAKELSIDPVWLLTGAGRARPIANIDPIKESLTLVPVFSWIHAGQVNEADMDYDPEEFVPIVSSSATLRALRVRGSSMNLKADDGDVIVVDYSQCSPYDGMLVVARVGDEVTFKKYRDTNGPIRLEPVSTEPHDTIYPAEGFEILGRVIWSFKRH
jgi:SOS-response transcriptional repressor LexA